MKTINTKKSMRFYQFVGLISIIIVIGGIGAWAALTSIQGAVIASGIIAVESHSKKVQHQQGGIVAKIAVKDGDQVEAGDLLINLDETEIKANLAIIDGVLVELHARGARLKAIRDSVAKIKFPKQVTDRSGEVDVKELIAGQKRLLAVQQATQKSRREQLSARIDQLGEEISGLKQQSVARVEQMDLITRETTDLEKLYKKGLVPVSRILALKRERSNLSGQKADIFARVASAKSKIGETKLQIIQLDDDDRTKALGELAEVDAKMVEMNERRIAIAARLKRMVIRAPQKGFVHQLNVHTIGGVIAPGETIMLIVPKLDDLVIEAHIDPKDIDQMYIGQKANIRFPAFNQRTTPEVSANVIQIAADLTQPADRTPPFYAIRLRLSKDAAQKLGDNKLLPGMPAEAFVQTQARTPLSYLLQPLTDQIARAFREN